MTAFDDVLRTTIEGCTLAVRAKPNAKKPGVALVTLSDNSRVVEVRIREIAEDGRANKAICETLAAALSLRKSAVTLKSGTTARQKVIAIEASAETVVAWLETIKDSAL